MSDIIRVIIATGTSSSGSPTVTDTAIPHLDLVPSSSDLAWPFRW